METARQLGKHGITVLVGARDESKGASAAEELRNEGIDTHGIALRGSGCRGAGRAWSLQRDSGRPVATSAVGLREPPVNNAARQLLDGASRSRGSSRCLTRLLPKSSVIRVSRKIHPFRLTLKLASRQNAHRMNAQEAPLADDFDRQIH